MTPTTNPLLTPSDLPFGLPPFADIDESHFRDAFDVGMAEQLDEIAAIVDDPEPPTFENTLVALERSGQTLRRVEVVFSTLTSSHTNPTIQAIQAEVAPKLAAHSDTIHLNTAVFHRIDAVHQQRHALGAEDRRLVERYHLDFTRAGAGMAPEQQERLRAINEELSSLSTTFQQHLLDDTNASAVVVEDPAELSGLSDDAISASAAAARERGRDSGYVLTLGLPTGQPPLATLADRDVRRRLYEASVSRANHDDDHDNKATAARMAALRAERAALFGHQTHASYQLDDSTAGSPAAVYEMLGTLVPAAVGNAEAEAAELQTLIGDEFELAPWDWAFYADRVRRERYEVDAAALRPYFELESVLWDGVFFAAARLYGLSFTERDDLVAYHPDARVFEVTDADGSSLGLFIGDYYARESKRGGAWMNSFVDQSHLFGTRPVVVNNLNIAKPAAGEPTLLTFDEVNTAFHEFGHALHGLFSNVTYPRFSGTRTYRDFVEYPSQVNEMWAVWPEVLANYAKHHVTGEPIPQHLVDKLLASRTYGEGYATTEYLAAALLDLAWHDLPAGTEVADPVAFESEALRNAGIDLSAVPPRYRTTYFAHIFSGGYSAGYYSYIWSEVLDADSVEWFRENSGLTRANGDHFRRTLLSVGGSVDPLEAFGAFRGRGPDIAPLLVRRGLDRVRADA